MSSALKIVRSVCAEWTAANAGWIAEAKWDPDSPASAKHVLVRVGSPPLPSRIAGGDGVPWNLYESMSRKDAVQPAAVREVLRQAAYQAQKMAASWVECGGCGSPRDAEDHCSVCGAEPLQ